MKRTANYWIKTLQLQKHPEDGWFKENICFQVIVPKNTWFAARLSNKEGFALVGCTVPPGFHFDEFEMACEDLIGEVS